MILGIEIGGTKLQMGVAGWQTNNARLTTLERCSIQRIQGAAGILDQIKRVAPRLIEQHQVDAIGIGFGGPVDLDRKCAITSHQVVGWDEFPLGTWCQQNLGLTPELGNDCNVAALAEATLGAGRDVRRVFYVTVGTGIGGGLVIDGRIDGQERPAVAEIGHLRPSIEASDSADTVESVASGLGMETQALQLLKDASSWPMDDVAEFERLRDESQLTAKAIAFSALNGNRLADAILTRATCTLGWAIAQVITLTAPECIVIGGGVSLIGPPLFERLGIQVQRFVFPPLADTVSLLPAALGEESVVHGAIQLVRSSRAGSQDA